MAGVETFEGNGLNQVYRDIVCIEEEKGFIIVNISKCEFENTEKVKLDECVDRYKNLLLQNFLLKKSPVAKFPDLFLNNLYLIIE